MAQIINDPYATGVQAEAGQNLGQLLKTGLEGLAQHKMTELARRKNEGIFRELGLNPAIAHLPVEQQSIVLKGLSKNMGNQFGLPGQEGQGFGHRQYSDAQQKQINTLNNPYVKEREKNYESNNEKKRLLKDLKELWETGKVATGWSGRLKPGQLQNTETRTFDSLSTQLQEQLLRGKGVLTAAKIKFAENQKPNITQDRETQIGIINRLIEGTEQEDLEQQAYEDIIEVNGGFQPPNLKNLVNQRLRQIQEAKKKSNPQESIAQEIPGKQQQQSQEDESPLGYGVRNATRGVARGVEAIAGAPGDLLSAGLGISNYLTGGKTPTYGDLQKKLPLSIPTSEDIKKIYPQSVKEYLEPRGKGEETFDDIIGTTAALFLPGKIKSLANAGTKQSIKTAAKYALPFSGNISAKKALGIAGIGTGAALTAEAFDYGPVGQGISKMLAMMAASTAGTKKQLEALRSSKFKATKQAFEGKFFSKQEANDILNEISHSETKTYNAARPESKIINKIKRDTYNDLLTGMSQNDGKLPVNAIIDNRMHLNEWLSKPKSAPLSGGEYLPGNLRRDFNDFKDNIMGKPLEKLSSIDKTGAQDYKIANDLHAGLATADKVKKVLENNKELLATVKSGPVKWLFNTLLSGAKRVGNESRIMVSLLYKSEQARKVYGDVLKSAAQEDVQAMARHIAKLDSIVMHESKKKGS